MCHFELLDLLTVIMFVFIFTPIKRNFLFIIRNQQLRLIGVKLILDYPTHSFPILYFVIGHINHLRELSSGIKCVAHGKPCLADYGDHTGF